MMNFDDRGFNYVNGLCFPHTCPSSEIQEYIEIILRNNGIRSNRRLLTVPENECVTNDPPIWIPTDFGGLLVKFIFLSTYAEI